jgi:hypothetical protein
MFLCRGMAILGKMPGCVNCKYSKVEYKCKGCEKWMCIICWTKDDSGYYWCFNCKPPEIKWSKRGL